MNSKLKIGWRVSPALRRQFRLVALQQGLTCEDAIAEAMLLWIRAAENRPVIALASQAA